MSQQIPVTPMAPDAPTETPESPHVAAAEALSSGATTGATTGRSSWSRVLPATWAVSWLGSWRAAIEWSASIARQKTRRRNSGFRSSKLTSPQMLRWRWRCGIFVMPMARASQASCTWLPTSTSPAKTTRSTSWSTSMARVYERELQSHLYSGSKLVGQSALHRDDMLDALRITAPTGMASLQFRCVGCRCRCGRPDGSRRVASARNDCNIADTAGGFDLGSTSLVTGVCFRAKGVLSCCCQLPRRGRCHSLAKRTCRTTRRLFSS